MNSSGWPVNWPEMSSESDGKARNAERIVTLKSSGTSRGRQKAVHKQKRFPASSPFLETVNTLEGTFVFKE